ncbi:MAG: phytanoyl-CoA dioxygenase family protein [Pseudomonadota bacterium]
MHRRPQNQDVTTFDSTGYVVVPKLLTDAQCDALTDSLPEVAGSGSRTLLARKPFREVVTLLRSNALVGRVLNGCAAVQCTLFQKSNDHNWSVRLHRDTVVCVSGDGCWHATGLKEGMQTARPPRPFIDACVALRLQLDGALVEDIRVVPGSHLDTMQHPRQSAKPVPVPRGGALLMRPSLVHGSAKLEAKRRRRVLHYLFAPVELPDQYRWYDSI